MRIVMGYSEDHNEDYNGDVWHSGTHILWSMSIEPSYHWFELFGRPTLNIAEAVKLQFNGYIVTGCDREPLKGYIQS